MASFIGNIKVLLGLETGQFSKGVAGAKKETSALESSMNNFAKNMGGMIAGAFAVDALLSFGKEASDLAGKLTGVETAFKKIDNGGLLNNLRAATKGTVSDLELMQNAVKAENLGLPVEQLGTYFEFARRTAKATGESVDYLVNSIVAGIGRKSPLILDNLGISTTQLNEQLKKTPDFATAVGIVIEKKMAKVGSDIDTAAERSARFAAVWDNFKVGVGAGINETMAPIIDVFTSLLEPSASLTDQFFNLRDSVDSLESEISPLLSRYDELTKKSNKTNSEQKELKEIVKKVSETIPEAITQFDKYGNVMQISSTAAKDFIDSQKEMMKIKNADAIDESVKSINSLNRYYKQLQATLNGTAGGLANIKRENGKIFEFQKGIDKFDKGMWIEVTDGVTKYQNKLKETYSQLKGHALIYKELHGETVKLKESEESITKTLTSEQLKALEDRKKKLKETYDEAQKINNALAAGFGNIDGGDLTVDLSSVKVIQPKNIWDSSDMEMPDFYSELDADFTAAEARAELFRQNLAAKTQGIHQGFNAAFSGLGDILASSLGQATDAFSAFRNQMAKIVIDLIAKMLAVSLANAITGATGAAAVAGPFAPAVLPVTIGTMLGAVFSAFASIPAFASGGLVTSPTMGLVGEGIGTTRSNPEVIAPLDKLRNFMPDSGGSSGNVNFRIEGNTLVGILDRQSKTSRYTR